MDKLKQLTSQPASSSPLHEIDIRNLFPKYQLSKIDKAKVQYDKFRLMMENIDDFVYIEKHRRENSRLTEEIEPLKKDIEELLSAVDEGYTYNLDIVKQRQNAQRISTELAKYGQQHRHGKKPTNNGINQVVQSSQPWRQYFNNFYQNPQQLPAQAIFKQKVHLAETIEIPHKCQSLNESTASRILLQRYRRAELNKLLLKKWANPSAEIQVPKELVNQWKAIVKQIDFQQYV